VAQLFQEATKEIPKGIEWTFARRVRASKEQGRRILGDGFDARSFILTNVLKHGIKHVSPPLVAGVELPVQRDEAGIGARRGSGIRRGQAAAGGETFQQVVGFRR